MCVWRARSEEHTSELQSHLNLVCRLLLDKKEENSITETDTYWSGDIESRRLQLCTTPTHFISAKLTRTSRAQSQISSYLIFFFNNTATTEISTLSLHDALPI